MLPIKTRAEIEEYRYRVCEVSWCEAESVDQFETVEGKVLELCQEHHQLIANVTLW